MTSIAVELNEAFSEPGATARPWAEVADVLSASEMFWLSTTRRDGRPHVTPLPAIWTDGALHFCTGDAEQKARNLLADPRCVLTTGANQYRSGLDVVVEGTAVRVTGQDPGLRQDPLHPDPLPLPGLIPCLGLRMPGAASGARLRGINRATWRHL